MRTVAGSSEEGIEILVYDPRRRPAQWSDGIQPTQCAVFLEDVRSAAPVSRDGTICARGRETCVLFDSIERAQQFCEQMVARMPYIQCEVLDAGGRANPPLLVVAHPCHRRDDHAQGWWTRYRNCIAALFIAAAIPLFYLDLRHHGRLVLPTFLGINLIVAALRILLWHAGAKRAEQDRLKRLEAYRRGREFS